MSEVQRIKSKLLLMSRRLMLALAQSKGGRRDGAIDAETGDTSVWDHV